MARKIIQIAVDQNDSSYHALCDDGTLWMGTWSPGKLEWKQIDAPNTIEIAPSAASNSRYATALEVLLEYGALDNEYQDEATFQVWLEERLNS